MDLESIDLFEANDIVSISINQNRLRDVILKIMAKLNHQASRIGKAQTTLNSYQENTESTLCSIQKRIENNQKQCQAKVSTVRECVQHYKQAQHQANSSLKQSLAFQENQLKNMKTQIKTIEQATANKQNEYNMHMATISQSIDRLCTWREEFQQTNSVSLNGIKEQVGSLLARMNYAAKKDRNAEVSLQSKEGRTQPQFRNSQFVAKKCFLNRTSKINKNWIETRVSLNKDLLTEPTTGIADEFVKEKLLCIQEQLQRHRRIIDKKLNQMCGQRMSNQDSKQNAKTAQCELKPPRKDEVSSQFKVSIVKATEQIQNKVNECKVANKEYKESNRAFNQRVTCLQLLVASKCDKQQVKSAFSFLEKKLKELILVVANQEADEKDAVMTIQQPVKCLSCNHTVQRQNQKVIYGKWKSLKGANVTGLLEMQSDYRNLKAGQDNKRHQRRGANSVHEGGRRQESLSKSRIFENRMVSQVGTDT